MSFITYLTISSFLLSILFAQPEIDPWLVGSGRPESTDYLGAAACVVARADWAVGR